MRGWKHAIKITIGEPIKHTEVRVWRAKSHISSFPVWHEFERRLTGGVPRCVADRELMRSMGGFLGNSRWGRALSLWGLVRQWCVWDFSSNVSKFVVKFYFKLLGQDQLQYFRGYLRAFGSFFVISKIFRKTIQTLNESFLQRSLHPTKPSPLALFWSVLTAQFFTCLKVSGAVVRCHRLFM